MHRIPTPATYDQFLFCHGGHSSAGVLDFSASINPIGPPASVIQLVRENLASVAVYPDPTNQELMHAVSAHHDVSPEQVVIGNGSIDLVYLIVRALNPRRVAIVEPTFTEYLRASLLCGAQVDHWLSRDGTFQAQAFDPGPADLVWVCNPNNPTGQLWPAAALRKWVKTSPQNVFIVDEAFMPFVDDEAAHSLVACTKDCGNLLVIRSLTKFWAIPGLRLGYAVGSADLISRMRHFGVPWSVNGLACLAGVAALSDFEYAERSRHYCRQETGGLYNELEKLEEWLEPQPSAANFVVVGLKKDGSATSLARELEKCRIRIRLANNFIGLTDRYFRIGIRKREDNQRLVAELQRILRNSEW